jgi:GNAT superfamily N-acetyltransferase
MTIRPTRQEDLPHLLAIYHHARRFMAEHGNPHQWGQNRPSQEQVALDIALGQSYVLEEEGQIEGVFALIFGEDPTYAVIEEGDWLSHGGYATLHRVASAGHRSGVGQRCFAWCKERCRQEGVSLRVDTHRDNLPMQRAILSAGFTYCGIIHTADGSPRLAYEYTISLLNQGGSL